jgi:hypothetical protein
MTVGDVVRAKSPAIGSKAMGAVTLGTGGGFGWGCVEFGGNEGLSVLLREGGGGGEGRASIKFCLRVVGELLDNGRV